MINACIDWRFGDQGLCLSKDALFRDWVVVFYILPFFFPVVRNCLSNVVVFECVSFFSLLAVSSTNGWMFKTTDSSEEGEISVWISSSLANGLWRPQNISNETAGALSCPDTQTELW